MGGCATKPKVLKGEEGQKPAPAPEPAKEEVVSADSDAVGATPTTTEPFEAKDVVVEQVDNQDSKPLPPPPATAANDDKEVKNKEIVIDGEKVDGDDQESKPRSLSNLFKTEERLDSTEAGDGPSEPVKEEESKEAQKPNEEYETAKLESQKSEVLTPESFVDAIDKDDSEERTADAAFPSTATATATATATETKVEESSEKKTEPVESVEKKIEAATASEEKKTEEAK